LEARETTFKEIKIGERFVYIGELFIKVSHISAKIQLHHCSKYYNKVPHRWHFLKTARVKRRIKITRREK